MLRNKKVIGLCVARIQDAATHEYITELNRIVSKEGYSVFVYNTCSAVSADSYEGSTQTAIYEYMDFDIIDLVIVYEEVLRNQKVTDALIEKAKKKDVPVIVIGQSHEGCINVKYDHGEAFAQVVRHMVEVHHKTRLHFMGGYKGNAFSEERLDAFRRVLEENNLPFDDSMVSYGNFYSMVTEKETELIVASGNIPEAIVCANDRMAFAVCNVLNRHGIRVPQDVAVTGFDGIPETKFMIPSITTVVCDAVGIAQKTAEVILQTDSLKGKTETFWVTPRLSIAESCGCNKKPNEASVDYLNSIYHGLYRFQEDELLLSQITAQVQRCESPEEVAEKLKYKNIIYDLCCLVEKEYLEDGAEDCKGVFEPADPEREMVVLFDADFSGERFVPYGFPVKEFTPHLDFFLENNRVLVFTALYNVDEPIGYACFFFSELNSDNYMKIPQTVNALSNAFGGYENLRHEQYLKNQVDAMYRIDTLTGLYNRRGFEIEYNKLLEEKKEDQPITIILADLDRLKAINDGYGHKEGDYAIRSVASALKKICPKGSICTRYGGDEMLAVCPSKLDVADIKGQFAKYFAELNEKSGKPYKIEASTGIYITEPGDALGFEDIVEKSDRLMYQEKELHKKVKAGL